MYPYQYPYNATSPKYPGGPAQMPYGMSPSTGYGVPPQPYGMQQAPSMMPPLTGTTPQKTPSPSMSSKGYTETNYSMDARLDRVEREIVEINRRLNNLTRELRRIENFLNIRNDV